jgi:hypothetical protein
VVPPTKHSGCIQPWRHHQPRRIDNPIVKHGRLLVPELPAMCSHRIFAVTELLSLICTNCDDPTRARLARTSRLFFDITTPILWGNLQGVHKILFLLPGTILGRVKPTDPPPKVITLAHVWCTILRSCLHLRPLSFPSMQLTPLDSMSMHLC